MGSTTHVPVSYYYTYACSRTHKTLHTHTHTHLCGLEGIHDIVPAMALSDISARNTGQHNARVRFILHICLFTHAQDPARTHTHTHTPVALRALTILSQAMTVSIGTHGSGQHNAYVCFILHMFVHAHTRPCTHSHTCGLEGIDDIVPGGSVIGHVGKHGLVEELAAGVAHDLVDDVILGAEHGVQDGPCSGWNAWKGAR